jgi:uncharacterized membrane protein YphA (DoxX/SURF4 family)
MHIMRIIARPFVAAPFVVTGLETLRDPGPRAELAAPVIKPLADRVTWLPSKDPETLVRVQAAVSVGAGALLALGRFQRLCTLLLAAEMVPSLLTEHRFWQEDDPARRATARTQLLKNAGLFGALLLAGTAPSGRHPIRAAKAGLHEARLQAALARAEAGRRTERSRRKAAKSVARTHRKATKGVARGVASTQRKVAGITNR